MKSNAATALPTIVGDLGGVEIMQWVTTTYILATTVTMPIYGKLGDVMGRKRLLMGCLGLYAAGKAVCGLTPNMEFLIVGRLVSGLGGGGLIILSQAALSDIIPPRRLGTYMGIMGSTFTACRVVGPLLGGWFVQVTGWRWIFWFTIPLALGGVGGLWRFLPSDSTDRTTHPDYAGMTCLAAAICSFVLALSWGGNLFAWDSWQVVGLFCVPMSIGSLAASTATGMLASKTGRYRWMPVAMCAVCAAGFGLMSTIAPATGLVPLVLILLTVGCGFGLGLQILTLIVQNEFPHSVVGTATAANSLFRQVGSTVGASLVGSLFTARLVSDVASKLPRADNVSLSSITPSFVDRLPAAEQTLVA
ncbi:MFS transporter [Atopobiaceae bacterium 24-176]